MKTTITAHCRIVTPMLSSGADQQEFEIRATEVKSGLRFWWRAFQAFELDKLFEEEVKLFGGTSQASPFTVRVSHEELTSGEQWAPGLAHGWGPGVQYLLFATNEPENNRENQPAKIKDARNKGRSVAKPGKTFEIYLLLGARNRNLTGDLLCALWLLENLGGLGGRTRRGAGCFEISKLTLNGITLKDARSSDEFKELLTGTPSFEFSGNPREFISQGLDAIRSRWKTDIRMSAPDYTAFYAQIAGQAPSSNRNHTEIFVVYDKGGGSNANKVMEKVGNCLKKYCFTHPYDEAKDMHTALHKTTALPADFELTKAAKGLPIIYHFSGFGGLAPGLGKYKSFTATSVEMDKAGKPIVVNGKPKGNGRRASPLLISCHQKGGTAYAAICHFPSPLVASGEMLCLWPEPYDSKTVKVFSSSPDHKFVKDMLHTVRYGKDRNGRSMEIKPLCLSFDVSQNVLARQQTGDEAPVEKESVNRADYKPKLPDFTPKTEKLVREIEAMKTPDTSRIDRLLEQIEKLQGADAKGANAAATALKVKLIEKRELWKKYGKRIGLCIED